MKWPTWLQKASWKTWILPLLGIAFLATGHIFSVFSGNAETPDGKRNTRTVSVVALLAAATIPVVMKGLNDSAETKRKRDDIGARAETEVALYDAIDPLVESLGELLAANRADRPEAMGRLTSAAMVSINQVLNVHRTRVCFYEVQDERADGHLVLKRKQCVGRSGRSRPTFTTATPEGAAVVNLLLRDQIDFRPDVKKDPPVGWDATKNRDYRTYLSIPSRAGERIHGLITVDAPRPGDLREEHGTFVRVVGTILATGRLFMELDPSDVFQDA